MTGRVALLRPEFVDFMPDDLEAGVLYISIKYKSVQHLCCCGCGRTVVTPLSPTGWRVTFDGRSISLSPSVGNWQKECGSHYFIIQNAVRWARRWTEAEIAEAVEWDVQAKIDYYAEPEPESDPRQVNWEPPSVPGGPKRRPPGDGER